MHWLLHAMLWLPVAMLANGDSLRTSEHPKQGLADLLMEYMSLRYRGHDLHGDLIYVSVSGQTLYHVRDGRMLAHYPVATAKNGLGCQQNSYCTPTGLHRIREKYGEGIPEFGILRDRKFTGEFADPDFAGVDKDWITTRVLWLEGLEPGHNQGGLVDSYARYIYIHGTANERAIGTPSSQGCIRMRNADVVTLFNEVALGALVVILDN
ncbi:MAG: L,D-transpeptidase [Flavobacteriales bacterium]|nr:L,D-transpeptidase [Flavobacteriales bacterium]